MDKRPQRCGDAGGNALVCLAWAVVCCLLGCSGSAAQSDAVYLPSDDLWSAWTSMRRITDVVAAPSGIWCATSGGVLRYQPESRTYTRLTRLQGLAGNQVTRVIVDEFGDLWFGTMGNGLSRLDPATESFASRISAFEGLDISALAASPGSIYVGTASGVSVLRTDVERVRESYRQFGDFPRDTGVSEIVLYGGRLWVGTVEGIAWANLGAPNLQDPDSWTSFGAAGEVHGLAVAGQDLFCGTKRGVFRWDGGQTRWVLEGPVGGVRGLGVQDSTIVALDVAGDVRRRAAPGIWSRVSMPRSGEILALSRNDTVLWAGTTEGLAALGAPSPPPFHDPPASHFYDLAMTADGALWSTSVPDDRTAPAYGVYRFDGRAWAAFDRAAGLSTVFAVAVEADDQGRVWVGTWAQGVAVRDVDGSWARLDESNSVLRGITVPRDPTFVVVSDLAHDAEGLMWLTNAQAGLAVMSGFRPQRSLLYGLPSLGLPPGTDLGGLALGPDGLKFIRTPERGFVVFDDGGTPFTAGDERAFVVNTSSESRLSSDNVTALLADGYTLWIGSDNGLHRVPFRYDRVSRTFQIVDWRDYRLEHGLPSTHITSLARDDQGRVWIGTRGGLAQWRPPGKELSAFTSANSGLIDDQVESLLYDGRTGHLWIGTFGGLSRLRLTRGSGERSTAIRAYPNPFGLSPGGGSLTFSGVPLDAVLRIYSAGGVPVRVLGPATISGSLVWEGANGQGQMVGSGVYYYVIQGIDGVGAAGKIAVVRHD